MLKTSRNAPCPCGGGKKYKKCCLLQEETSLHRRREEQGAVEIALDWLHTNYPAEIAAAVRFDYLGEPDDEKMAAIDGMTSDRDQLLGLNIGDWLLADAVLTVNKTDIPALDLILGKEGPLLPPHGREWLQEICKRSLSLYEVREIKKGEGMFLADMLKPSDPPVWVRERSATQFLVPWDILGARLALRDGDLVMSGAAYPMERGTALACREVITGDDAYRNGPPDLPRDLVARTIINCWLDSIITVKPLPLPVDASSGNKALVSAKPPPKPAPPLETQQQIITSFLAKQYESWPEIPLPALHDKTPSEAVKTEEGRRAVAEILKTMEQSDARLTNSGAKQPLDITFLWEKLGLIR